MLNNTKSLEIMDALLNTKAKTSNNTVSFPINPYLGLFITVPDDNGENGVEPSTTTTEYRRVLLNKKGFEGKQLLANAVTETQTINDVEKLCAVVRNQEQILFPEALTSGYGTITGFGIFESSDATTPIAWGKLTTSQEIKIGEIPIFRIDEFEMMLA